MPLQGSNVLERSSELIHSGELTRIVRQGKMQQRSFFLFDHQLIYCKKDVLRRDLLHYRGRLDTDQTEVLDVPDGRDQDLGLTLRNALRLRNASTLELTCVLCCRKAEDKQRWIEAFAKERHRVKEDQEMGEKIFSSPWSYCCFIPNKKGTSEVEVAGWKYCHRQVCVCFFNRNGNQ